MFDIGDRPEAEILVDDGLNNRVSFAESDMHLYGALAMPDIVHLLFGVLVDIAEDGGQIVVGHMLEGELPELFIFVGVVLGVVA